MPHEFSLFEKSWLRASFELRCLTGSFARTTARFEKQANLINSTVGACDYALLGQQAKIPRLMGLRFESCDWTIFQVVEHLRLHTEFVLNCIQSLIVGDQRKAPTPKLKYLVPDDVGAESLDRFQDTVWQYVGFANNIAESRQHRGASGSILHPLFGRLDIKRLHAYGCLHLSIHHWQIQKIIATQGVV